jgi:hypothetical protein
MSRRSALNRMDHSTEEMEVQEAPESLAAMPVRRPGMFVLEANDLDLVSHEKTAHRIPSSREVFTGMVRFVRSLLGLRDAVAVKRCKGTTRAGAACRGMAMANGLCRMHGGSRYTGLDRTVRQVRDRMTKAADQFAD